MKKIYVKRIEQCSPDYEHLTNVNYHYFKRSHTTIFFPKGIAIYLNFNILVSLIPFTTGCFDLKGPRVLDNVQGLSLSIFIALVFAKNIFVFH